MSLVSSPAVVAYDFGSTSYIDTYVVGNDGSLKEAVSTNDGSGWAFHWNDLGRPGGIALASTPAVVAYSFGGTFFVDTYVLGNDGSLKEAVSTNDGSGWAFHWNDLGQPGRGASSPSVGPSAAEAARSQVLWDFNAPTSQALRVSHEMVADVVNHVAKKSRFLWAMSDLFGAGERA